MNTENLKPFDLKAALNGEPVMLRNGMKAFVRYRETEEVLADSYCIWGVVRTRWDTCTSALWTEDGRIFGEGYEQHGYDIIGMYSTSKTRIINGFEVPAPETIAPKMYHKYFVPCLTSNEFYRVSHWDDDKHDNKLLQRGLVFLNKEDVIANSKAMLGIDPYQKESNKCGALFSYDV